MSSSPRFRRPLAYTALAAFALSGLAACGSDDKTASSEKKVATLGSTAPAKDAQDETTKEEGPKTFEEAELAYKKCMSEKGIDPSVFQSQSEEGGDNAVVDQSSDGAGSAPIMTEEEIQKIDEALMECGKVFEGLQDQLNFDPEQEAAMKDMQLFFNQCMKEEGIPDAFLGMGDEQAGGEMPDFNEEAMEKLEAANKICGPKTNERLKEQHPELAKKLEGMGG